MGMAHVPAGARCRCTGVPGDDHLADSAAVRKTMEGPPASVVDSGY